MENQLKVARWLGNYEQKTFEIIQEEIDIINEMAEEEMLAGLCLIQEDALEEDKAFLLEKLQLTDLIQNITSEVKELKKTLKF